MILPTSSSCSTKPPKRAAVSSLGIALLAFSYFAASLAAKPERIFIPDFELSGSQLLPILGNSLSPADALAFRSEDAMKERFAEEIGNTNFQAYIFLNRAIQVTGEDQGGYESDFIDKAKKHLGSTIKGFVVPIRKTKVAVGPMTINNLLTAYIETIQEQSDYQVVFLVEYAMRNVVEHTEIYESQPELFALCPDHYDGMPLSKQLKFYNKFGSSYPTTIAMPVDLRHDSYRGREELGKYLASLSERPLIIQFANSQTSFAALADFLEIK